MGTSVPVTIHFKDGSTHDFDPSVVNKVKADFPGSYAVGPAQQYLSAPGVMPLPGLGVSIPTGAKPYLDAAPGTLGMIGSELGTPFGPQGRAAGAALGGGLGTAAQMVGNNLALGQPYPAHPMSDIAQSAAGQAAASLTGDALVGGLGKLANPFMRYATRGTEKVADTALRLGGGVGSHGLAVARRAVQIGKEALNNRLDEAAAQGVTFNYKQLLPALNGVIRRGEINALSNADKNAAMDMMDTYLAKYGPKTTQEPAPGLLDQFGKPMPAPAAVTTPAQPISPQTLQIIKEEADAPVQNYYEQLALAGKPRGPLPSELKANAAVAAMARDLLGKIGEGTPGHVASINRGIANALELSHALTRAANRPIANPLNLGMLGAMGTAGYLTHNPGEGALIGLGARAIADPHVAAGAALGMVHPALAPAVDAAGHAAASALFPWKGGQ